MHPSVMEWVADKISEHQLTEKTVLECGSRNVNGSVRPLFKASYYVGVDMEDGRDVDYVCRADSLGFDDGFFDVVVSTEMLEHDPYFWLSLPEMARVLKPGGVLLLTTRGIGFPYHEHPSDYWRFTLDALEHLFDMAGLTTLEVVEDPLYGHPGVFGLAVKPQAV